MSTINSAKLNFQSNFESHFNFHQFFFQRSFLQLISKLFRKRFFFQIFHAFSKRTQRVFNNNKTCRFSRIANSEIFKHIAVLNKFLKFIIESLKDANRFFNNIILKFLFNKFIFNIYITITIKKTFVTTLNNIQQILNVEIASSIFFVFNRISNIIDFSSNATINLLLSNIRVTSQYFSKNKIESCFTRFNSAQLLKFTNKACRVRLNSTSLFFNDLLLFNALVASVRKFLNIILNFLN